MKNSIRSWSITVALAGFLFGFDTVVISGANLPTKALWNTSPWFHGMFIMSMALWGTVIGALFGGVLSDKIGRKRALFWIGVLYFVSAVGSCVAPDPYAFSFFRFIGGLGIGASSVAAPTYISEISGAERRGRLVGLYQFNIVFGIFLAYISNYLLKGFGGDNDWRWMMGVEAIPAGIYTLMVLNVPDSPRWLIVKKKDNERARAILERVYDANVVDEMISEINGKNQTPQSENIFVRKYGFPLLLAFLVSFFNQLSGINFILYYAPQILEMAGVATRESLYGSIYIGLSNLVATLIGIRLIDSLGRKQLMLIGSFGYIVSLFMISYAFYTAADPVLLLIFIVMFIASHAMAQGVIIWVFISEIFPTRVRANGQAFGCGVHWIFAALITLVGPVFINIFIDNPWPIFAFFGFMMILQLLFAVFIMPETKGVSLEDLERKLVKSEEIPPKQRELKNQTMGT